MTEREFSEVCRPTDPGTSWAAAPGGEARRSVRDVILHAHKDHPMGMADFELWALIRDDVPATQHLGLIAKRRGDLVEAGDLEATEMRRRAPSGRMVIVWRYASPVRATDGKPRAARATADRRSTPDGTADNALFDLPPNPGRFAR